MASGRKAPVRESADRRKSRDAARKQLKRNRQPRAPRRKVWEPADPASAEYELFERIMPIDEGDRRRAVERLASVRRTEGADEAPPIPQSPETRRGLVLEVSTGLCLVDLGDATLLCPLRGSLTAHESAYTNVVAAGDEVLVHLEDDGSGVVEAVLPRRSVLARPDVFHHHRQQIIVANVDQLLIVAAWREPALWLELIDRYLITAMRSGIPALICINKIDLAAGAVEVAETLAAYGDLAIPLVLTSALTGAGLADLHAHLQGRVTVLAGLSGVGKSTLLTTLRPDLQLRTGRVSEREGARGGDGRHTTTQATLLRLDATTTVVDTPGIREFGLSGLRRGELAAYFAEIQALARGCRFNDCAHMDEPGCAVRRALAAGALNRNRYHSYRKIYQSLPAF